MSNFCVLLDNNYQVKQFKNMRRRTLLGGGSTEYVFSAQSTSVSVNYNGGNTTVNIKSTANGSNIGYSVVSYDGTVVTSVGPAATYVTFYCTVNSDYSSRSGNVVLKQNDSNKTITINVSQSAKPISLDYDAILLDGTSGSYGIISFNSKGNEVTFSNIPSWADVYYSNGYIYVTATTTNSASTARLGTMTVSAGNSSTSFTIIQLPSDYHSRSYISIGSKNWAIKNVGASSVKDYGNYYQWGAGAVTFEDKDQYYTGSGNLPSTADTATVVMGSGWRMPTQDELQSLSYTSFYRVSYNGVNGGVFNSSGNVLFLPFGGLYYHTLRDVGRSGSIWSSMSTSGGVRYAYRLGLWVDSQDAEYPVYKMVDTLERVFGISVRGVQA